MPKVTEEHRAAMRVRIQDAALTCFARKGFATTSMADIVKEAGLSAGAVYIYYSSKAELVGEVSRRITEERMSLFDDLSVADGRVTPEVVFPRMAEVVFDECWLSSLVLQVWGEAVHETELAEMVKSIFGDVRSHSEAYLSTYFQQSHGLPEVKAVERARRCAPAILALIQGGMVQAAFFGVAARAQVAESIVLVLRGLDVHLDS